MNVVCLMVSFPISNPLMNSGQYSQNFTAKKHDQFYVSGYCNFFLITYHWYLCLIQGYRKRWTGFETAIT